MSVMHLNKPRLMKGGHVMRHVAGHDIFMRLVDRGQSGAREFAVLVVGRRRAEVLPAANETKFWMEDECVIARIKGNLSPLSAARGTENGRVIRAGNADQWIDAVGQDTNIARSIGSGRRKGIDAFLKVSCGKAPSATPIPLLAPVTMTERPSIEFSI